MLGFLAGTRQNGAPLTLPGVHALVPKSKSLFTYQSGLCQKAGLGKWDFAVQWEKNSIMGWEGVCVRARQEGDSWLLSPPTCAPPCELSQFT